MKGVAARFGKFRPLLWAVVGAVGTGVLAYFSERLTPVGTALIASAGFLLGWAIDQLSSGKGRRTAAVMFVAVVVVAGAAALFPTRPARPPAADTRPGSSTSTSTSPTPTFAAPFSNPPPTSAQPTPGTTGTTPGSVTSPPDPARFDFDLNFTRVSHTPVTVSVFAGDTSNRNRQEMHVWVENLSVGGADFDIIGPGGDLDGWGGQNDDFQWSMTYLLDPDVAGNYGVKVTDRETGATAQDTVYLEAGDGVGPVVVKPQAAGDVKIEVAAERGRACDVDAVLVVLEYWNIGPADSLQVYLPYADWPPLRAGTNPDSIGHGHYGVLIRGTACTGTSVGGFRAQIVDRGGVVLASTTFSVSN